MTLLEELQTRREKLLETINNVLEAGQEFQTRTGRVKQVNLPTLQAQLASIDAQIAELKGASSAYTDTELLVFRGCR